MRRLRVCQFNVLGDTFALAKYFPYARNFLPEEWEGAFLDSESSQPICSFSSALHHATISVDVAGPHQIHADSRPQTHTLALSRTLRLSTLMSEILSINPDLFAFCEVDSDELIARISETYDVRFWRRPGGRQDGCLLGWKKSAGWSEVSHRFLEYPKTQRIAVEVILCDSESRVIRLIGTHLFWDGSSPLQIAEADVLVDFVNHGSAGGAESFDPAIPTILCGDLNTTRDSTVFKKIASALHEVRAQGSERLLNTTRPTSIVPDLWIRNGNSWEKRLGRKQEIDFIFVSSGIRVLDVQVADGNGRPALTGNQGVVLRHDGLPIRSAEAEPEIGIPNAEHGSDHFPVFADIELG